MNERLTIDPDFAAVCWKLTGEELQYLEESLIEEGCRDPIVYWNDPEGKHPIVDGYNRHLICCHKDIPYPTVGKDFPDRSAAIRWSIRNQLGRRNASSAQYSQLRAKLFMERQSAMLSVDEPDRLPQSKIIKGVAEDTGVSERQVQRDIQLSRALDKIASKSPELRDAILEGDIDKKAALILAGAAPDVLASIVSKPRSEWRGCSRAAANAVKNHRPQPTIDRPIVAIKELSELERAASALVRVKTRALEACGGKKNAIAAAHEEVVRQHMNAIFDEILAWQRDFAPKAT
jgi:Arc/MetJ-type ribon-helix-helix transcriptional regulator